MVFINRLIGTVVLFLTLVAIPLAGHGQTLSDITGSKSDGSSDKPVEEHHVTVEHEQIEQDYFSWTSQLERLERRVAELENADKQSRRAVDDLVRQVGALSDEIKASRDEATASLEEPKAALSTIGPVPPRDEPPEAHVIAQYRETYERKVAQLNAHITFAKLASEQADRLIERLALIGEVQLLSWLTRRQDPATAPADMTIPGVFRPLSDIDAYDVEWLTGLPREWNLFLSALAAVLSLAGLLWFRRRASSDDLPSENAGEFRALAHYRLQRALARGLLPALFFVAAAWLLLYVGEPWTGRLSVPLAGAAIGAAAYLLFFGICNVALAPRNAEVRVLEINDSETMRVNALLRWWCMYAAGFAAVIAALTVSEAIDDTAMTGLKLLAVVGFAILTVGTLLRPVMPSLAEVGSFNWDRIVRVVLIGTGVAALVAAVTGYINAAVFTAIHVTGSIVIAAATYFIRPILHDAISATSSTTDDRDGEPKQHFLGTLLHLGLDFSVLAMFAVFMLAFWGVPFDALWLWFARWSENITIGALSVSLSDIVTAIAIFVLVFVIMRKLVQYVSDRLLNRMSIDAGVRNSIVVALGYLSFAVAVIAAIAILGVSLTNLALIFGALSLGVGFGLQNTVDNFVSGLILLLQRPIKVGDWIGLEDNEGFVKRIGVISTEITTVEEASVIIPNSELISSAVVNRTLGISRGRVDVPIGVAYGTDVTKVFEILRECADENDAVLDDPEPAVVFLSFSDSSLDFELRVFIPDIRDIFTVATDLRVAILNKFAEKDVQIPFPQRDLHLRTVPERLEIAENKKRQQAEAAEG